MMTTIDDADGNVNYAVMMQLWKLWLSQLAQYIHELKAELKGEAKKGKSRNKP